MIWRIRYRATARRNLRAIAAESQHAADQIAEAIHELQFDPRMEDARLRGYKTVYKLKIPPYRVLYCVLGKTITVFRIEARSVRTYRKGNPH